MRLLLKLIVYSLILCLLAIPVCFVFLGVEDTPWVQPGHELTYDNIERARRLIKDNRPHHLYSSRKKTAQISEPDINLLLDYAVSHGLDISGLFVQARLDHRKAKGVATFKLPKQFFGQYINLAVTVKEKKPLPGLVLVEIGQINIPGAVIQPVITFLHKLLLKTKFYATIWGYTKNIEQITLQSGMATLHYYLDYRIVQEMKRSGRQLLLPMKRQHKLLVYHNYLADLTRDIKNDENAFIELIKKMMAFAAENSETTGTPITENRTVIQVLSLYVTGHNLNPLLDPSLSSDVKRARRIRLQFYGRTDLPKHFIVSAALAVSGGSKLADFIGIAKEVEDSDGGSGFSFADLAADKAGIRFGEMAIRSDSHALVFQKNAVRIDDQADIIPSISNLPEGITKLEFKKSYKDLDSAAYRLVNAEIDDRISRCLFYKR